MKQTQFVIVEVFNKKLKRKVNQRVQVTVDFHAAALALVNKATRADNKRASTKDGALSVMVG